MTLRGQACSYDYHKLFCDSHESGGAASRRSTGTAVHMVWHYTCRKWLGICELPISLSLSVTGSEVTDLPATLIVKGGKSATLALGHPDELKVRTGYIL
jgi:hypothetical protein